MTNPPAPPAPDDDVVVDVDADVDETTESWRELRRRATMTAIVVGVCTLVVILLWGAVSATLGYNAGQDEAEKRNVDTLRSLCGQDVTSARNQLAIADATVSRATLAIAESSAAVSAATADGLEAVVFSGDESPEAAEARRALAAAQTDLQTAKADADAAKSLSVERERDLDAADVLYREQLDLLAQGRVDEVRC